jgi:tetratricopeptide (TPR) repeat protein
METHQATLIQYLELAAASPWTYAILLTLGTLYVASFLYSANGWRLRRMVNIASLFATAGAIGWFTTTGAVVSRPPQTASTERAPDGTASRTQPPRRETPSIVLGGSERLLRNLRAWRADQLGGPDEPSFLRRWIDGRSMRRQRRYAEIPSSPGYAHWQRGHALLGAHRTEEAEARFRAARAYFIELLKSEPTTENRYAAALALEGLGISAQRRGRHEDAARSLGEAREELNAIDDAAAKRAAAAVALTLADVEHERNRSETARQRFGDAITDYERMQDLHSRTWRRATGSAYLRYGRFETQQAQHHAASDAFDNAGRHFAAADAKDDSVLLHLAQAELDLAQGRFGEARRRIETAQAANRVLRRWDIEISSLMLLGRVALAEGRLDEAIVNVDAARLVLRGLGEDIEVRARLAAASLTAVEINFRRGRSETGRQMFAESLVIYRAMLDHRGEADAYGRLALLESRWGGAAQAVGAYVEAFAQLRRVGDLRGFALLESDARDFCAGQAAGARAAVARFCRGREVASTAPLPPSSATDEKAGPSRPAGGPR